MAKKGQRFRKYTDEERDKIVTEYISSDVSYASIGKKYGISRKTVETMVAKYRKTGTTTILKRTGRPKESDIDYKERYNILKKYLAFLKAQRERK